MKDLEDEADRLLEKLQPIKKLQDNLRRNISQIKELINQARKQANSVSCQHTIMSLTTVLQLFTLILMLTNKCKLTFFFFFFTKHCIIKSCSVLIFCIFYMMTLCR